MYGLKPVPFKTKSSCEFFRKPLSRALKPSKRANLQSLKLSAAIKGIQHDSLLFCFDFAGAAEGLPVLFGLVGVEGAEIGEGFCEGRSISEITRDHQRIA